jgi:hypothetical protein
MAWMRVEMVSLGSERVSLRIGRVTFKIPCFGDLIAGSVASVAGSPCPIRSKGRISIQRLMQRILRNGFIYRTHLLKACLFECPAQHSRNDRASQMSQKKRIALSSKGRLINRRLVHQAQFRERADLEDDAAL